MRSFLLFLVATTLLAGCAAPTTSAVPTPSPRPPLPELERITYTVKRGDVLNEIVADGRVAATIQQELSFKQDGLLTTLYVKAGDTVTEGQLLGELDLGTLPTELEQVKLEYELATVALDRAAETRSLAMRRAQIDLADARGQLDLLRAGSRPGDVAAADARVKAAISALETVRINQSTAKTNAELDVQLAANVLRSAQDADAAVRAENKSRYGDTLPPEATSSEQQSSRMVEDAQTRYTAAQIAFDKARQLEVSGIADAEAALDLARAQRAALDAPPEQAVLAAARRRIQAAELSLEQAGQSTDPEAETRVARARLELDRIQQVIDTRQLVAPFAGVIASVNSSVGSSISAYRTVITEIDATEIEMLMQPPSPQNLARIGVGQQVELAFRSRPQDLQSGTISQLPSSAGSRAANVGDDDFIHITFEQSAYTPRLGESAEVTIPIERRAAVLWLPPAAVRSTATRSFVVLRDGTTDRRVDVIVGLVTDEQVEIVEGLDEGMVVVGE